MDKPTFKNRANEEVNLPDGRTIWLSRSPAVVAVVLVNTPDGTYILTEKRSAMMDEPNKQALVSGYLDWDESGYDGIVRETWEETSFHIPAYKDKLIFNNSLQPFYVHSDPWTDAKQNVSLTYIFIYNMDLPMEIENFHDAEIDSVKWMKDSEVDKYEWAFDHDRRIGMALSKYNEYLR